MYHQVGVGVIYITCTDDFVFGKGAQVLEVFLQRLSERAAAVFLGTPQFQGAVGQPQHVGGGGQAGVKGFPARGWGSLAALADDGGGFG